MLTATIFRSSSEEVLDSGLLLVCVVSAPDGSSPRVYGQVLAPGHRLKLYHSKNLDLISGCSPSFYRLLLEGLMKLSTPAGGFVELSAAAPEYSGDGLAEPMIYFLLVGVSPRVASGGAIHATGSQSR